MSCLLSCSSGQHTEESEETYTPVSNEIDLSAAIPNLKEQICLSEWVDSIIYIPLETKRNNLLGGHPNVNITPEYIYYGNHCFNWDGNHLLQIGRLGQGPGEEPGFGIGQIVFIDSFFYSLSMKFIEYDHRGRYTGKEKRVTKMEGQHLVGTVTNVGTFKKTGKNMIAFNIPDTVYFFNTGFDIVGKYPIMEWGYPYTAHSLSFSMTHYNDTILFYNYSTDTVYHATENILLPKWIIKLQEEDKISSDYMYDFPELFEDAAQCFINGNMGNAKFCNIIDNKIDIKSVNETDRFLFILCNFTMYAPEQRKLPPVDPPFLIRFDKFTGKIEGGKKLIDNIGGMDTFLPLWGICNDKMVNAIWPYELDEFIREKQEKGQKVDSRLLELMDKVDIEDNPVMIVAYLKK
ncbi:MAG: 6-bladed beta-propeller [Tannerellaceae bacterium]|nr:6-bladed beta-propeller [Tannerellaceae bacterium]